MLPALVRGASSEAGSSLEQKSYYFHLKIHVFFENVLLAAMRSGSREAPQEQKQNQEQKQDEEQEQEQEQSIFL